MKKLLTLLLFTSCMLVNAQNSINLPVGWSMFGYNCEEPVDALDAFNQISDKIVIVKDHFGNVYLPEQNFNAIGNLSQATGYQIKMNETVVGFEFCESVSAQLLIDLADLQEELNTNSLSYQNQLDIQQADYEALLAEQLMNSDSLYYVGNLISDSILAVTILQFETDYLTLLESSDSIIEGLAIQIQNLEDSIVEINESFIDWCASDSDNDGICDADEIIGCMDNTACNFVSEAEFDDDSCYNNDLGCGCDNPAAVDGFDCDGNELPQLQIGSLMHGGMVFYIDETGEHGLVAATEDLEGLYQWGCFGTNISGAVGQNIGTGYQNTLDIVASCSETPIAASEALAYESGGYSDWYLPSRWELNQMYYTIGNGGSEGNIGGFESDRYWSSSYYGVSNAWYVTFYNGGAVNENNFNTNRVRVIRAF